MSDPQYEIVDVSLEVWRGKIMDRYPTAKIYRGPEELGGERDAYVDQLHVGNWCGAEDPPGTIRIKND